MWLALLKRFWPFIAGALVLLGAWLWHLGKVNEAEKIGYHKARAEFAEELERERLHQREINDELDRQNFERETVLQRRIDRLLARNDAIRLCEPAGQVSVAGDSGESQETGGADGQTYRAGENIGPRLVEYGAGCEALRQQVAAWQEWYGSLAR